MTDNRTQIHRPVSAQPQPMTRRQPPAPRPAQRRRYPLALALGGLAAGAVLLAACALTALLLIALNANRVPGGVRVADVLVGGLSREQAQRQLEQTFSAPTVILADGARQQAVRLSDLGIRVDLAATVEQAQAAAPNATLLPVYQIDLVQAQNALFDLGQAFHIEPVAGSPGRAGRTLEIPVLLDRLRLNAAAELADGRIDLPMIEIAPPEPEPVTAANYNGPKTTHIVEPGQELGLIAKQYNVPLSDLVSLNNISNPDLLYVGQQLTIPAAGEYVPSAAEAPAPSTTVGKAIVVSVGKQRIYAYENGALVRSHLTSTGRPNTPTVLGDYKIYVKYAADDMSGPGYYLPQVPYTMYFYQGYAIHGTYWHNSFGRPMSHGCVNLPVDESQWFFNWAEVGTPVRVVA
jgi:lipoprotein-anchoring transpeptidase ErfK/SrfK